MRPRKRLGSSRGVAGLVSVVIATRERPRQLSRVLRSVRLQTYGHIETIVVNDSSAANISKLATKYSVKHVIKTNMVGHAAACNEGFLRSRGEFLIFPDDDMELQPTMIAKLVDALSGNPSKAYAYCGFKEVDGIHVETFGLTEFDPTRLVLAGNYISVASLIRREKFVETGMFDPGSRRLEDWDLWLSLLERGQEGVLVPEILFSHIHLNGRRMSSDDNPRSFPYEIAFQIVERKHAALAQSTRIESIMRADDPFVSLLKIYWVRSDLQQTFPEAKSGDYQRLIEWARNGIANNLTDLGIRQLSRHIDWFTRNPWTLVRSDSLAQYEGLRAQISALSKQTYQLESKTVQSAHRNDELQTKLRVLEAENARLLCEIAVMQTEKARSVEDLKEAGKISTIEATAPRSSQTENITLLDGWKKEGAHSDKALPDDSVTSGQRAQMYSPSSYHREPLVSIVIPNHNGRNHLERCVRSIVGQTYRHLELVLVDNGSSDGSVEFTKTAFPTAIFVSNDKNLGFARALNQGVRASSGTYILALNNDTTLEPDCIQILVDTIGKMEERRRGQLVGLAPKTLLSNSKVIDSVGSAINPDGSAFNVGIGQVDLGQFDIPMRVFGLCFAAAFIKRSAFDRVGFLDESYFAYYEDVDWCYRANMLGYAFYSAPSARVHHDHSASARSLMTSDEKYYLIHRNFLRTIIKHYYGGNLLRVGSKIRAHAGEIYRNLRSLRFREARLQVKILAATVIRLPLLLAMNFSEARARVVTDYQIWGLASDRIIQISGSTFSSSTYSPVVTLDVIEEILQHLVFAFQRREYIDGYLGVHAINQLVKKGHIKPLRAPLRTTATTEKVLRLKGVIAYKIGAMRFIMRKRQSFLVDGFLLSLILVMNWRSMEEVAELILESFLGESSPSNGAIADSMYFRAARDFIANADSSMWNLGRLSLFHDEIDPMFSQASRERTRQLVILGLRSIAIYLAKLDLIEQCDGVPSRLPSQDNVL